MSDIDQETLSRLYETSFAPTCEVKQRIHALGRCVEILLCENQLQDDDLSGEPKSYRLQTTYSEASRPNEIARKIFDELRAHYGDNKINFVQLVTSNTLDKDPTTRLLAVKIIE